MRDTDRETVSRLLDELRAGNADAAGELFSLVYDELRALAKRQRQLWRGNPTVNTTALVHEAYLKLVSGPAANVESRSHFLGIAAKAMRHILCNYARAQRRQKRGGELQQVTFDELRDGAGTVTIDDAHAETLVGLDRALRRLEQIDARRADIVACRFFGGLTIAETAMATGTSPATVKREWALARAWLYRELQDVQEA